MINKKLAQKITDATNNTIELLPEEIRYAEKHELLRDDLQVIEIAKNDQFNDAIIERFEKDTEESVSKDTAEFLKTPLTHFKEKKNEFLYLESTSFDVISVDAFAVEYDEVFEVYTAMFGLSIQKKYAPNMKDFLDENFHSDTMNYSMMFSAGDGLWEVNLPLNYLKQFDENFSIEETYHFLYTFIFALMESVED